LNKRKQIKEIEIKKENKEKNLLIQIKNRHLVETKERFESKNLQFKTELEKKLNTIDNRVL